MGNKNVTDQIIRIMEAKDDIKSAVMEAGVTVPEELSIDGYGDKVREISGNMNSRITAIEEKIPDNAASDNKLADKNFVSSSISNAISGIDLGKGVVAGDGTETSDPGDGTRKVSVKRDKSSESFLSVSVDGVKVSGIQTAISSAISGIETSLNKKQDTISDLETIRSNASSAYKWGDHSKAGYLKSVGDATITIKQDGTVKGSFTMNQTMDMTVNLTDTNTTYSSLTAASGGTAVSLVTTGEKYTWNNKQDKITSSNKLAYSLISGTPSIPTKVSQLTNDSNYATQSWVTGQGYLPRTGGTLTGDLKLSGDASIMNGNSGAGTGMIFFSDKATVVGSIDSGTTKALDLRSPTGHATIRNNNALYTIYDSGNANITSGEWKSGCFTAYAENGLLIRTNTPSTSKGVIFRNDTENFYLLTTPANDTSWDTLRPFSFNLASGTVSMGHDVSITGTLTVRAGKINSITNNTTYELKFPAASGTIALTTDIPSTLPANGGTANFLGENKGSLLSAKYGNYGGILQDSTNGPRSGIWSNRIKILHSNKAGYYTELAQEFNGSENHLYFRELNNGSLSAWKTVWDSSNLTKVSQLTNDAGYLKSTDYVSVTPAYLRYVTGSTKDKPYVRVCYIETSQTYFDWSGTFTVDSGYSMAGGLFKFWVRMDSTYSSQSCGVHRLVGLSNGIQGTQFIVKTGTDSSKRYWDLYFYAPYTYGAANIRLLNYSTRGGITNIPAWTFGTEAARAAMDIRTYDYTYTGTNWESASYLLNGTTEYTVGLTNGHIPYYCNFPGAGNLVSLGYNTSDKINDDNSYFKGLCKWIGATYKNKEAILIGMCQPNSQGWCIIHKYPHENNSEGYPRYLTGTYQTYLYTYTFTIWDYKWYWNGGITATTLARSGDVSKPMTFNWAGKDGQPTWLWGGEDGTNMYVYNPRNFAVDTATRIYSGVSNDFNGAYSLYYTAGQFSATAGNGVVYKTTYYPTSATSVTSAGVANIMNLRLDWDSTHKYWHDIFASPNYNTLWHRSVIDDVSSSWYRIVQEDGGTYSITSNSTNLVAGYSPSRYVPNWGYYNYAETPGYLILTDIPVNTNTMFVAHIWGNSYSNYNLPLDLYIQGYTYSAKVFSSSVGMLSLGRWIDKSYIFSYNGNVGIWIPHTGSFVSLYADIRITSGISTPNLNHCISITGSSKPSSGISDEVAIPMHCSIHYNEGTGGASLNSLAYNGYYYINEAASNYPTNTQNGHLLNLALSDTKTQLIIPYLSKGSMWYRGGSTSLGTWKQILDDNNYSNFALPLSGGKITGMLEIQADKTSWREGIRIYPYNSWSTIVLGGNDLKSSSGTTTNTWSIHNNNGNFWIAKNGSDSNASAYMGHTNQWWFNDSITSYGSLISNSNGNKRSMEIATSVRHYVKSEAGGWAWGLDSYNSSGSFMGSVCGTYGSNDTLNWYYFGGVYNDSLIRLYPGGDMYFKGLHNYFFNLSAVGPYVTPTSDGMQINLHNANNAYSASVAGFQTSRSWIQSSLKVGSSSSPSYALDVNGDIYTSGWSRAASGFYIQNTGVHFTNQGTIGEIDIASNNELCWGSNNELLYFNYRKPANGTTAPVRYIWNAGSSTSYAEHFMSRMVSTSSGGAWVHGRDNASVYKNNRTDTSWCTILSQKTKLGDLTLGVLGTNEYFEIAHVLDSKYNAGTNDIDYKISFPSTSGTLALLSNIPSKVSQLSNDTGYITGISKSMVENVLTGNITSHTHSQYLTSHQSLSGYATQSWVNSQGFAKGTIPSVGNGTVTIKQAGVTKGTFTMNQTGNTDINLTDTNTTYSSLTAASGGTAVSLVTTGEKYTWNNLVSRVKALEDALAGKMSIDGSNSASTVQFTGTVKAPNGFYWE